MQVAGNVEDKTVMNYGDDGVTQKATIKSGLASMEDVFVPNPVTLQPFQKKLLCHKSNKYLIPYSSRPFMLLESRFVALIRLCLEYTVMTERRHSPRLPVPF